MNFTFLASPNRQLQIIFMEVFWHFNSMGAVKSAAVILVTNTLNMKKLVCLHLLYLFDITLEIVLNEKNTSYERITCG